MSLLLGLVLTGIAAVAGTVLCPPAAGRPIDRDGLPGLALAVALAALAVITSHPAGAAERLTGRARIIDGATLAIDGVPVALSGIVAPAADATCSDAREVPYACGHRIQAALAARIGAEAVTCTPSGREDGRTATATCLAGGTDLGEWMVAQGYAVPAREAPSAYRAAGDRAWGRRLGLWGGVFTDPAGWRQAAR
ncbi:thermonuclease family protein [Methylobacterium sp. J-076]|uniref:thermonuclease family protein n=1 Tax=Methylobacterium sp. J-076 TaxID=2836655 RepID=UPI001FB98636|nr:thermonuclease family protein [Methylobacterium sp. J-076]MCJ2012189.1 thermonuclease family protein [Methylobacterium sp. J-076]